MEECRWQGHTSPLPGNHYESEPRAVGAAVTWRVAVGAWMGGARGTGQLQTELLTFTPDFAGLDKKIPGFHVCVNLHEAE